MSKRREYRDLSSLNPGGPPPSPPAQGSHTVKKERPFHGAIVVAWLFLFLPVGVYLWLRWAGKRRAAAVTVAVLSVPAAFAVLVGVAASVWGIGALTNSHYDRTRAYELCMERGYYSTSSDCAYAADHRTVPDHLRRRGHFNGTTSRAGRRAERLGRFPRPGPYETKGRQLAALLASSATSSTGAELRSSTERGAEPCDVSGMPSVGGDHKRDAPR